MVQLLEHPLKVMVVSEEAEVCPGTAGEVSV
jgi:hypothetical protein